MRGYGTVFLILATIATTAIAFRCPTQGVFTAIDPNKFYLCGEPNAQGVLGNCDYGKGFLQTSERTGCIPYTDWHCTNKNGVNPPTCYGNTEIPHLNPNMYWKCFQSSRKPELMVCPDGKGFTKGYGCVDWSNWYCKDRYDE